MKIPTARDSLVQLGIGQFNATMIIPFMFMAPATTDPRQPSILMLVRQIQRNLYKMGATNVVESGFIDQMTAAYLDQLVGPGWLNMSWAKVVSQVVNARQSRIGLTPLTAGPEDYEPKPVGAFDFLPDVPGGMLTYAIGGIALWWYLTKDSRTATRKPDSDYEHWLKHPVRPPAVARTRKY